MNVQAAPSRIGDVIHPWVERTPDGQAIVDPSGAWTYRQLSQAIAESEQWLSAMGIRAGDRVMLVGENCRVLAALLLAASGIDAWPVPVSARYSAREIEQIREHCGARRVIYTTSVSPHAREHAKRDGAIVENIGLLGTLGIGALNEAAGAEPVDASISDRVAVLIYTSGTTGLPKGVMLTHRNLLFIATWSSQVRRLTPADRIYGVLPMFHVTGLSVALLGALLSGASLHIPARFDPAMFCDAIQKDQLTIVLGVPGMFALLCEYAKTNAMDSFKFPSLRIISSSGAPLDTVLKTSTEKLFGLTLNNGYGVTECSPTIAQTRIDDPRSDTSAGPIIPNVEVKLVGPQGNEVLNGDVGELRVRGPNVMKGYYRSPEETSASIDSEGWFNTRDLGRLEQGHLHIVGRTKELIIRFGFNVYPAEIEAVLNSHPEVAKSAVIGRTIEGQKGDEQIIAFVQAVSGSKVTATELSRFAGRNLSTYKRPSHILILEGLPLTPSGKVAKRELVGLQEYKSLPADGF